MVIGQEAMKNVPPGMNMPDDVADNMHLPRMPQIQNGQDGNGMQQQGMNGMDGTAEAMMQAAGLNPAMAMGMGMNMGEGGNMGMNMPEMFNQMNQMGMGNMDTSAMMGMPMMQGMDFAQMAGMMNMFNGGQGVGANGMQMPMMGGIGTPVGGNNHANNSTGTPAVVDGVKREEAQESNVASSTLQGNDNTQENKTAGMMPGMNMMSNMPNFGTDGSGTNFQGFPMNMMPGMQNGMNMPGAEGFGMSMGGMQQSGAPNAPAVQQAPQPGRSVVPGQAGIPVGPSGGFRGSMRGRGGAARGVGAFRGRGGARE
jgi:hypothetical protein